MSVGYGQTDPWDWDCEEYCGQDTQQNMDSNNCWVPQNYNHHQHPMVCFYKYVLCPWLVKH